MESSEQPDQSGSEQPDQSAKQSLTGLLASASTRVQEIIESAESSAAGIVDDAREEARRYADDARQRVDEVSRERTKRVGDLTDELTVLGEELIRQAEAMRTQAQALAAALGKATNEIYSDLAQQHRQLSSFEGDVVEGGGVVEDPDGLEMIAELDAAMEEELDDDGYALEPRFDEERTLALDDASAEIDANGRPTDRRRRSFGSLFRRRDEETGTGELAVIDEPPDTEPLAETGDVSEQEEDGNPVS